MAKDAENTQKIVDNQSNTVAYINPNSIDENKFELNLIGEKFLDGDDFKKLFDTLNKNFITLTQNFYNDTAPKNPVIGQTWINGLDNMTYIWFGHNWIQRDRDVAYDCFMYVKYGLEDVRDFIVDEFVFNYTMNNIKIYNQDMKEVRFVIDSFDSRKIVLKERNITTLYVLVFHPKDRITNPLLNKKMEIRTTSGQTQFDISSFVSDSDICTLSVSLNDTLLKSNEFFIVNGVLNLDGKIYRIKKDDKLMVWLNGGSLAPYFSTLKIHTNKSESFLKIPKFFRNIESMEIVDCDMKVAINPLSMVEYDDYFHFEFMNKKNIKANVYIRTL